MRKLIVFLVVVVLLGAGYSAYWHKKADDFKQMFVQSADALNASAKPLTKELQLIKYDAVTVTGFPAAMVIEVSKPVFEIPVSALIAQTHPQAGPAPYEWVEEVSFADKMTISGNITGNHFTTALYGDRLEKALINGKPRHSLISNSSSPLTCSLGVERPRGGGPWVMQPLFNDPQTFLAIFRSAECDVKGTALKDAATGAPLLSSESVAFSASNESDGSNQKMALKLDTGKTKAEPAFDALVNDYTLMTYSLLGKTDQMMPPMPFSEYGEHTVDVDIAYDGPTSQAAFADANAHIRFDINTLSMQTALGNFSLVTHVASAVQGNERTLSVAFHETGEQTAHADELGEKRFVDALNSLQKGPIPPDPLNQALQRLGALPNLPATIAKIYPRLSTLGKAAFDVDFTLKGPNQRGAFFQRASLTLDDFDITATPYGIKTKGSGSAPAPGKPPAADFSLTCLACDALITDLGNYAMRVEPVIDAVSQTPRQAYVNQGFIDGVRQFVHGIAENGTASDLVVRLVLSNGGFTISGKQVPEVLALYMTTIAPHMPQRAPAAGSPSPNPMAPSLGQ